MSATGEGVDSNISIASFSFIPLDSVHEVDLDSGFGFESIERDPTVPFAAIRRFEQRATGIGSSLSSTSEERSTTSFMDDDDAVAWEEIGAGEGREGRARLGLSRLDVPPESVPIDADELGACEACVKTISPIGE